MTPSPHPGGDEAPAAVRPAPARTRPRRLVAFTLLSLGALAVLLLLGVFVGSGGIGLPEAWNALTSGGDSADDLIVRDYRVPRTLLAVVVGSALGCAGALIQAITRNPLADPGILGVNSGAFFVVAIGSAFFGVTSISGQVWLALLGALLTSLLVYAIGSTGRSGGNPAQLVLTGVAIGAVFSGISHGITLLAPETFDRIRFWAVGSLQGRQMDAVVGILPFVVCGLVLALLLMRSLNALALGDELARSLGNRVGLVRGTAFLAITLLCGAATAAAGPIGFLGLMVPHAVRLAVGPDQRLVIPLSMLFAPIIMLAADIIGRLLLTSEVPVGLVVAFLGAPVLTVLVRRKEVRAL